jgi:chromate reductase, NAD(P)H dehydrogenase (quinone)
MLTLGLAGSLRRVLGVIGADVVDLELPVGSVHEAFGHDGALLDPDLDAALSELVGALVPQPSLACGSVAR